MNIVLTGGGSAGHVMPNLALLPHLTDKFDKIFYIGSENGCEKRLAESKGIAFRSVPTVKLDRTKKLANLKIPFTLYSGISEAKKLLRDINADIVFAKGGYVSLPAAFAARSLNIPVICHESDYSLGLANRLISGFAVRTLTSFESTKAKNAEFTGNPVRLDLLTANALNAKRECAFLRDKKTVLFVGGSGGAAAVNSAVRASLSSLTPDLNVIHIAGAGNKYEPELGYRSFEFVDNVFDYYAYADVVVSRAGANCASELAAMGKRVIFIPLPKGASRGDQLQNADFYAKRGCARVLEQDRLCAYELVCAITDMLSRPSPDPDPIPLGAGAKIADILYSAANAAKA